MERLKVVWICSLSNSEIRERLQTRKSVLEPLLRKVVKRDNEPVMDSAIWNTNGINEMKRIPKVELHVVGAVRNLYSKRQDFEIDGIYYHFVRDENSSLLCKVQRYLFTRYNAEFKGNRKHICDVVRELDPNIIHVIGAENPQYSLALLDLPKTTPTILQLQALLASIVDKTSGQQRIEYEYKANLEKRLIQRADYIGTRVPSFIDYIRKEIKPDATIVNTTLAMAQKINLATSEKMYDFVHFAATLGASKATDVAIEAFAVAYKTHPEITLDIIGGMAPEFQEQIEERVKELGLGKAVTFEGRLPTHDDVIDQIRKARFALLPLKVSIVPNTLHEAMANGLPVITTVTPGTPKLNEKRNSVLIAENGDIEGIASYMVRLIEEPELGNNLRENAALTEHEKDNNEAIIKHWVEIYKAVCGKREGKDIPSEFLL